MSAQEKLIAHKTSVKIENALKQLQHRDCDQAPTNDPTIYIDDNGNKFKTTERIMKEVPPPTTKKLRDSQLFSNPNGAPNYKLLKEHYRREGKLSEDQVLKIITMATDIFIDEPNMLIVPAPVTVCGDIHGQFYDLLKLFEVCGDPEDTSFLFLGDYVDRGSYSLEVLLLLYSMKINHPTTFFLLRGNHETRQMTAHFTFENECILKYSKKVYESSLYSFTALPITAIMNNQFLCVHGGISKDLKTLEDIDKIDRFQVDFPSSGIYCDLMWSDPSDNYDGETTQEMFKPNYERGCSYMYSYKAVCRFLQQNNLLCVIRAHQAQDSGYRMYKKTQQQFPSVITLFSAPNYCGSYGNKAAVLKYENMVMNIRQFSDQPEPYRLPNFLDVFTWSIPFVAERTVDILLSLLNVCTEEELGEESPLAKHLAKSILGDSKAMNERIEEIVKEPKSLEQNALRNKILAIGRVSRMFNLLRQEAEKVEKLRSLSGGSALPKGVLLNGADELDRKIMSFEEARLADLENEAMPVSDSTSVPESDAELYNEFKRKVTLKRNKK